MKTVLDYVNAVSAPVSSSSRSNRSATCQTCNYLNNYYGDQVCVPLTGKKTV